MRRSKAPSLVRKLYFKCPDSLNREFLHFCSERDLTRSDVLSWYVKGFCFRDRFQDLPVSGDQPEGGNLVDCSVLLHRDVQDLFYTRVVKRHRSVWGQVCAFMRDFVQNPGREFD